MERLHIYPISLLPASSKRLIACRVTAILLIALIAGSTFGIWQGYDPALYSQGTFLEVHQGAVRGLNTLLPVMGFATMLLTLVLTLRSNPQTSLRGLYWTTLALLVLAGLITRFANQPINAVVMAWTTDTMPGNWAEIRDTWWFWHTVRTLVSIAALAGLVTASVAGRSEPQG
jgi:uncharacterized membrane protein